MSPLQQSTLHRPACSSMRWPWPPRISGQQNKREQHDTCSGPEVPVVRRQTHDSAGQEQPWAPTAGFPRARGNPGLQQQGVRSAATRNGTTLLNTPAGVASSSTDPAVPPAAETAVQRRSHDPFPCSSGREAAADPGQHATSATVFATLACSAGTPACSSTPRQSGRRDRRSPRSGIGDHRPPGYFASSASHSRCSR